MESVDREKVIKGLECCARDYGQCGNCPYDDFGAGRKGCGWRLYEDALALLKAQEAAKSEPKRIDLADETKAWLDKMDAVDALGNIADICIDWDGYRTADGLGGLINEIWAYARYCADKLLKAQEPRVMTLWESVGIIDRPVYLERNVLMPDKSVNRQECWALVQATDDEHMIRIATPYGIEKWHVGAYGIGWRCWTSRPTDAEREATLWMT